jgi:hypothetical protein
VGEIRQSVRSLLLRCRTASVGTVLGTFILARQFRFDVRWGPLHTAHNCERMGARVSSACRDWTFLFLYNTIVHFRFPTRSSRPPRSKIVINPRKAKTTFLFFYFFNLVYRPSAMMAM